MKVEILQQPDSAIAHITLNVNEGMMTEAGAMIAMSEFIYANTTLRQGRNQGILGGLKRAIAGESIFLTVFRSSMPGGELYLAPKTLGDIKQYQVKQPGLVVQAGSYLASGEEVDVGLGFAGFKSWFAGESLFWLDVTGYGLILLSAFGAIYEIDVDGEYIVDTGHIVAFEKSLNFQITKPGKSWLGAFFGKEGLVCQFQGKGKLFCQTHNPNSFGQLIGSQLPPRSS